MIHLDTSVLIDLHREMARERPGAAFAAMESIDGSEILAVSVHVVGELQAGVELSRQPLKEQEALDQLLSGLLIVRPDERFAPLYGRTYAAIRKAGRHIDALDLLIATAALIDDAPLLTKNVKDFSKVPGLRVIHY